MILRLNFLATKHRGAWLAISAIALVFAAAAAAQLAWSEPADAAFTPVPGSPFGDAGEPSVAFSPSGKLLATADFSKGVAMFSVATSGALAPVAGSPFAEAGATSEPVSVAFRPDGGLVATANRLGDSVSLFTVAPSGALTPAPGSPVAVGDQPATVAFSADGSLLAVANYGSGTVSLYAVSAAGALTEVPGSPVSVAAPAALAFGSTGLLAVTNYGLGTISVFSVSAAGALTPVAGSPFLPRAGAGVRPPEAIGMHLESIAFDATGTRLALLNVGDLSVFSVSQAGALSELQGSPVTIGGSPSAVAFGPGGMLAVANRGVQVGSTFLLACGPVGLYSITDGAVQQAPGSPLTTCQPPLYDGGRTDSVAFSPDGELLATGSFVFTSKPVAPGAPGTPAAVAAQPPAIDGTAKLGARLTCSTGAWTNNPTAYAYQWTRNATPILGATLASYVVRKLDEGNLLRCIVAASNATGRGVTASSRVRVAVERVARCPRATGSASSTRLGLLRLGRTRQQARRALRHSAVRATRTTDAFCLTPYGITAGYPSSKLLAGLAASRRSAVRGRVVWMTTASAFYALRGIRAGSTVAAAQAALRPGAVFHVGRSDWYFARYGSATAIVAARGRAVRKIGLASRALTRTRAAQRRLLGEIR